MNDSTLSLLLFPVLVFYIRSKRGPKMKIFGHTNDPDLFICFEVMFYLTGATLLLFTTHEIAAYLLLIASCVPRPAYFFLTEVVAVRYHKKHATARGKLNHAIHGKALEQGVAARTNHK